MEIDCWVKGLSPRGSTNRRSRISVPSRKTKKKFKVSLKRELKSTATHFPREIKSSESNLSCENVRDAFWPQKNHGGGGLSSALYCTQPATTKLEVVRGSRPNRRSTARRKLAWPRIVRSPHVFSFGGHQRVASGWEEGADGLGNFLK